MFCEIFTWELMPMLYQHKTKLGKRPTEVASPLINVVFMHVDQTRLKSLSNNSGDVGIYLTQIIKKHGKKH